MLVNLASKASCRNVSARLTAPAAHATGSRARNPKHPAVKREGRKIGAEGDVAQTHFEINTISRAVPSLICQAVLLAVQRAFPMIELYFQFLLATRFYRLARQVSVLLRNI